MTTPISDEEIADIVFPRSAFEDLPEQTWERACLRLCARVCADAATIARQSAELAALRAVVEAARAMKGSACDNGFSESCRACALDAALAALDAAKEGGR